MFCPDLRRKSGQDTSPDVVSGPCLVWPHFAPANTHTHATAVNSQKFDIFPGHMPSSCRLTLVRLDRHGLQCVVALRRVCVCFFFSNSYNPPPPTQCFRKYDMEPILGRICVEIRWYHTHCSEILLVESAPRFDCTIHTVRNYQIKILIFRRRNESREEIYEPDRDAIRSDLTPSVLPPRRERDAIRVRP